MKLIYDAKEFFDKLEIRTKRRLSEAMEDWLTHDAALQQWERENLQIPGNPSKPTKMDLLDFELDFSEEFAGHASELAKLVHFGRWILTMASDPLFGDQDKEVKLRHALQAALDRMEKYHPALRKAFA